MKLSFICGTRPEILKLVPLIEECDIRGITYDILFTCQHFSYEMGEAFFKEFEIDNVKFYNGKIEKSKIMKWLIHETQVTEPDYIIIQGDTNSSVMGALTGLENNIEVCHIEAGLRSFNFNEPFPEEQNRCLIDSISSLLFCPTETNLKNLGNLKGRNAYVVGNTILDLIKQYELPNKKRTRVLITLHRRENWKRIDKICKVLKKISNSYVYYNFTLVKHGNKQLADIIKENLDGSNIDSISPQTHKEFINLVMDSALVISDSGGIVEEASFLGIPVVSVRNYTERQEALESGHAVLSTTEPKKIEEVVCQFLDNKINITADNPSPFGSGNASKKILNIIEKYYKENN